MVWWPFGERDKGTARGSNSTNTSTSVIVYFYFVSVNFSLFCGSRPFGFLFLLEGPNAAKKVEVIWWPFEERDKGTGRGSNSTNTSTCIIIYLFLCL